MWLLNFDSFNAAYFFFHIFLLVAKIWENHLCFFFHMIKVALTLHFQPTF
jgi:hypothetical protein